MAMEKTDHTEEILLSIPSEDKHIYLLDLVISYVSKEMEFDEETTEQVNLAVIEAGTNAIKHGNGGNPGKITQFRFCIAEDKLTVFVKDHGSGFDPGGVGDPLSPENVLKPSGRGIFLMNALMDEVAYNINKGSGTEVRLVKYKPPG
jgi:serine/threonine-protein kinase RsbW